MISILIPAYNQSVAELVNALHQQCISLNSFEIIVADDASEYPYENEYQQIAKLSCVRIFRLDKNIGRARIRNLLAHEAQYELLLFIDGDAANVPPKFIQQYITAAQNFNIVCGGTYYTDTPPSNKSLRLRWKYGRKREMHPSCGQVTVPAQSFTTFNFLIRRSLMRMVGFDTNISSYGHEDTIFGIELSLRGLKVAQINAPLLHTGLDTAEVFLAKTRSAVRNLHLIAQNSRYRAELDRNVRLLKAYRLLKALFLAKSAGWLYAHFHKTLSFTVTVTCSLLMLDLYKLAYFCHITSLPVPIGESHKTV